MATYVPGVETYLPDIKPFTPDYKFLSAVMDIRQDKYNINWKATNDIYNKVVYAGLSRKDTTEQRNQYINNLGPSLEKIAGMDLSLSQNAASAKAVFAPFFEDKLIVKDMLQTANYRKEKEYANHLLNHPNLKLQDKYSALGVKGLDYRMQDFINANPEEALRSPLPKYVEDANLFKLASEVLAEMKPPLKIKIGGLPMTNQDGTVNPDWIVTQQNGDLVVGPALQYIQNTLQNNPKVQQAYREQAYVASRDAAAEGMANGIYSTVKQGQNEWAKQTIATIEIENAKKLAEQQKILDEQQKINDNWTNFEKTEGIIPGSDEEQMMKEKQAGYEVTKAMLDNMTKIVDVSGKPLSENPDALLDRAYQMMMYNNMGKDMLAAAQNFSMREFEYEPKPNKFALQSYDLQGKLALENARATNARMLEELKHENELKEIDYKINAEGGGNNPLAEYFKGLTINTTGGANTTEFTVDEDGNIDPNADIVFDHTLIPSLDQLKKTDLAKVDWITDALIILNPSGNDGKQNYNIEIGGQEFTGSIEQIKNKLLTEENGQFVNKGSINTIYDAMSKTIQDNESMKEKNPSLVKTINYQESRQNSFAIDDQVNSINAFTQSAYQIQFDTYNTVKGKDNTGLSTDAKGWLNAGMPDIWVNNGGVLRPLTRDEYYEKVLKLVKEGKVTNYDENGIDTGTSNKNYKIKQQVGTGQYADIKTADGVQRREIMRTVYDVDLKAVQSEAFELYDELKGLMNQALTGSKGNFKTATYKSKQQDSDIGTASYNPEYSVIIDPKVKDKKAFQMATDLLNQIDYLSKKGLQPIYVSGMPGEGEIKSDNGLSKRVLEMFKADLNSYLMNPESGNSVPILPRAEISYSPVYGATDDGKKETAGYFIQYNDEWLQSKFKGSISTTGEQYGALNSTEIRQMKNGTSIIFEQKFDISPRNNATASNYNSSVLAGIATSDNNTYTVNPIDDNGNSVGTYKFWKAGKLDYRLNWQYNVYDGDGKFSLGPEQTVKITKPDDMSGIHIGRLLDQKLEHMRIIMQDQANKNYTSFNKDKNINNSKKK